MLSGEKKKYSPYLDTGLMETVSQRAASMGISVNEYITQALISFMENNPSEVTIKHWIKRFLSSPDLELFLTKYAKKAVN